MRIEANDQLTTDDGEGVENGYRIYDKRDGHFVGYFIRFCHGDVMVLNTEMTCNCGDELMRFPRDCGVFEHWMLKPALIVAYRSAAVQEGCL